MKKYIFDPDAGTAGEFKLASGWTGSADSLKGTSPKNRKIYFASFGGIASDKNNLTLLDWSLLNNSDDLQQLSDRAGLGADLGLNNDALAIQYQKRFFQWFRGYGEDVYLDDPSIPGRDDKLFDIFHSGMVLIGAPSADIADQKYTDFLNFVTEDGKSVKDRISQIYVQANSGLLHAFNDTDGTEKWAFLPPNVIEKARLRGLKWSKDKNNPFRYSVVPSSVKWDFDKEGSFIPRYMADGPVLAEDVLFEGESRYRTVLLAQLGFGGAGMYMLDVTDPDSPKFVWAVENDFEDKNQTGENNSTGVYFWGNNGTKSERNPNGYANYSTLRKTGSAGFLGFLKSTQDGVIKRDWYFLMGNGSNPDDSTSFRGEVYLGKVSDGSIKKRFLVPTGEAGKTNAVIVTPIAVPLSDEENPEPRHIQRFFVGDDEGRIFKADIGDLTTVEVTLQTMYSMGGTPGFSYTLDVATLEPKKGVHKREDWIYLGTGDLERYAANPGDNIKQNYFFALNTTNPNKVNNLAEALPPAPITISTKIIKDAAGTETEVETEVPTGWKKVFRFSQGDKLEERLTTAPIVYYGYIYFGTTTTTYDKGVPVSNTGRVYILDARTGQQMREYTVSDSIISGISISGGRLVIGVSFGSDKNNTNLDKEFTIDGFRLLGNNILYTDKPLPGTSEFEDSAGKFRNMTPLYWKTR